MEAERKGRIYAMEALYRFDLLNEDPEEALNDIKKREPAVGRGTNSKPFDFARDLIVKMKVAMPTVDELIRSHLENWNFSRLTTIDKILLRLGTLELLYFPETPFRVIINEILRISHIYSQPDSHRIINGVLDSIADKVRSDKEQ